MCAHPSKRLPRQPLLSHAQRVPDCKPAMPHPEVLCAMSRACSGPGGPALPQAAAYLLICEKKITSSPWAVAGPELPRSLRPLSHSTPVPSP